MSPEFQELAKLITQQVSHEVADRVTERVIDRIRTEVVGEIRTEIVDHIRTELVAPLRKEMDERFAETNAQIAVLSGQVSYLSTELPLMIKREIEQVRVDFDHKIELVNRRIDSLALLIENVSESLHREMRAGFAQMEDMSRRLDKHASMLQTGARWTARMATWSERVDQRVTAHEQRLQRLEGERPQTPPAA